MELIILSWELNELLLLTLLAFHVAGVYFGDLMFSFAFYFYSSFFFEAGLSSE